MKRILFDICLFFAIGVILICGLYVELPNPIQVIILKITFVSAGVLHAHIMGKNIIPVKVDWDKTLNEQNGAFYARVILYITLPILYSFGV